jgi:hypothetical protein
MTSTREQWQVFADFDAGSRRRDRLEFAADIVRGIGFRIETIVLAQPSGQEDEDHRFGGLFSAKRGNIGGSKSVDVSGT